MRRLILAVTSAVALVACGRSAIQMPTVSDPEAQTVPETSRPDAPLTAFPQNLRNAELTPEGFTFYTVKGKIETIRLLAIGGAIWSVSGKTTTTQFVRLDAEDATLADGTPVRIMHFLMKARGNGSIEVVKRISTNLADPITETRTINFVVR